MQKEHQHKTSYGDVEEQPPAQGQGQAREKRKSISTFPPIPEYPVDNQDVRNQYNADDDVNNSKFKTNMGNDGYNSYNNKKDDINTMSFAVDDNMSGAASAGNYDYGVSSMTNSYNYNYSQAQTLDSQDQLQDSTDTLRYPRPSIVTSALMSGETILAQSNMSTLTSRSRSQSFSQAITITKTKIIIGLMKNEEFIIAFSNNLVMMNIFIN